MRLCRFDRQSNHRVSRVKSFGRCGREWMFPCPDAGTLLLPYQFHLSLNAWAMRSSDSQLRHQPAT